MAFAEETLTAALLGTAAITAAIGTRLAPAGGLQDEALPAITYQRISTVGNNHLDGGSTLDVAHMQINSWAVTARAAKQLADLVRRAIEPLGDPGDPPAIGTFITEQGADFDIETRSFGVKSDFSIWEERT
tara:strand:+ start:5474 stop:5866 length:393 start_codon:yes stop_codon:yes gene_type:complete